MQSIMDFFGGYPADKIGAYATALTGILTAAIALFAALQLRASRKQQSDQAFFYFHQYLANTRLGDARWYARKVLSGKPLAQWSEDERSKANVVAASYDQAAILLDTGGITQEHRRKFLKSSWGESICDQYEILSAFLNEQQTPQKTGREFFVHFAALYAEAAQYHPAFRIITGGQTGVDQGALAAAAKLSVPYGGWCPKGGATEPASATPQTIPDVRKIYPNLKETVSDDPAIRTALNAMLGTHTLILHKGPPSFVDGTKLTVEICEAMGKPVAIVSLDDTDAKQKVLRLFQNEMLRILLNVAGPRESLAPGIQHDAEVFMIEVLPAIRQLVPRLA